MSIIKTLYQWLIPGNDSQQDPEVAKQARPHVPSNFFRLLLLQLLTKLADVSASTRVVIPSLLQSIGVPTYFIGLLVPLRESGSMLPQAYLGHWLSQIKQRRHVYAAGALLQAMSMLSLLLSIFFLQDVVAGIAALFCVLLFSLSRSLCSISSKDLTGQTIPVQVRGRLSGWGVSASGVLTIALGLWVFFSDIGQDSSPWLLALAGSAFVLATVVGLRIKEPGMKHDGEKPQSSVLKQSWQMLRTREDFRQFMLVRGLLICSGLALPYFVLLYNQQSSDPASMGMFILASGFAAMVGGNTWGILADKRSSRLVLRVAAISTTILCLIACFCSLIETEKALYIILFFLLSITHEGVRLGRKTYLINMAEDHKRTLYVATSNSMTGLLLLAAGLPTALLGQTSIALALIVFAFCAALAGLMSLKLTPN